jgi:hypothetical protein
MAGIYANLGALMNSDSISLSRTPFNQDIVVLKRPSFPKGVTPKHLEKYLIKSGECKGRDGKVVFKGHLVPATSACVAEKHSGREKTKAK